MKSKCCKAKVRISGVKSCLSYMCRSCWQDCETSQLKSPEEILEFVREKLSDIRKEDIRGHSYYAGILYGEFNLLRTIEQFITGAKDE